MNKDILMAILKGVLEEEKRNRDMLKYGVNTAYHNGRVDMAMALYYSIKEGLKNNE